MPVYQVSRGLARSLVALSLAVGLFAAGSSSGQTGLDLSTYEGMSALAGDDHRHAGSSMDHLRLVAGNCNGHELGPGLAVFDQAEAAEYDWVNLSYHDGGPSSGHLGHYQAWIDATGFYTDPTYDYSIVPSPLGFPDFRLCPAGPTPGNPCPPVDPPWNETLSHSTAAMVKNVPGSFLAFAGREYTPASPHTIAIPNGDPDTDCTKATIAAYPLDDRCPSISDLYRWTARWGKGVLIRAHPLDDVPDNGFAGWNPDPGSGPAYQNGFSDSAIQGIEVGNFVSFNQGQEAAYRTGLRLGYRLFPSYGSDLHGLAACKNYPSLLEQGAAICWVRPPEAASWNRQSLIDAMHERRCYYSRAFKPDLRIEACAADATGSCTGPVVQMGGLVNEASGRVRVRITAMNDPANQDPSQSVVRRLSRLELVSHDQLGTLLAPAHVCTLHEYPQADVCDVDTTVVVGSNGGSFYARICEASGCGNSGTVIVSPPIFVNWSTYRLQAGRREDNDAYDAETDSDGVPWIEDNCPQLANPGQQNSDEDTRGDACDNCPNVRSEDQADFDQDGEGDVCDVDDDDDGVLDDADACDLGPNVDSDGDGWFDPCDNCTTVPNPGQEDSDTISDTTATPLPDGIGDACDNCTYVANRQTTPLVGSRTTTGEQLDDDADGTGNACDLDYDNDGSTELDVDVLTLSDGASVLSAVCPPMPDPQYFTTRCELLDADGEGESITATGADGSLAASVLADPSASSTCASCGRFAVLPCLGDNCGDSDPDNDLVANRLDNCPTIANTSQTDADGDLVGDACDNCTQRANPRVASDYLATNTWATLTGGQRDDDHDGYGNVCDGDFNNTYGLVNAGDLAEFRSENLGKSRALDTCGLANDRPCAIFDMDEVGGLINATDLALFRTLLGEAAGPRCATCPLTCSAGVDGSCGP